ncbi:MAG: hypothetical protein ACW98F_14840 [Candidatus Hodarchaeales archaeon]
MKNYTKSTLVNYWLLLVLTVAIYSLGDAFLKIGNIEIESELPSLFTGSFWIALISNFSIIIALIFAFTSKLLMGVILSKHPLGLTEGTFLALSTIFAFIFGVTLFRETITVINLISIGMISFGIFLLYIPIRTDT